MARSGRRANIFSLVLPRQGHIILSMMHMFYIHVCTYQKDRKLAGLEANSATKIEVQTPCPRQGLNSIAGRQ